jgi:hypothetical protein
MKQIFQHDKFGNFIHDNTCTCIRVGALVAPCLIIVVIIAIYFASATTERELKLMVFNMARTDKFFSRRKLACKEYLQRSQDAFNSRNLITKKQECWQMASKLKNQVTQFTLTSKTLTRS